jgi:hypothetical protein
MDGGGMAQPFIGSDVLICAVSASKEVLTVAEPVGICTVCPG